MTELSPIAECVMPRNPNAGYLSPFMSILRRRLSMATERVFNIVFAVCWYTHAAVVFMSRRSEISCPRRTAGNLFRLSEPGLPNIRRRERSRLNGERNQCQPVGREMAARRWMWRASRRKTVQIIDNNMDEFAVLSDCQLRRTNGCH